MITELRIQFSTVGTCELCKTRIMMTTHMLFEWNWCIGYHAVVRLTKMV